MENTKDDVAVRIFHFDFGVEGEPDSNYSVTVKTENIGPLQFVSYLHDFAAELAEKSPLELQNFLGDFELICTCEGAPEKVAGTDELSVFSDPLLPEHVKALLSK